MKNPLVTGGIVSYHSIAVIAPGFPYLVCNWAYWDRNT